jgi:hypothetical protein
MTTLKTCEETIRFSQHRPIKAEIMKHDDDDDDYYFFLNIQIPNVKKIHLEGAELFHAD